MKITLEGVSMQNQFEVNKSLPYNEIIRSLKDFASFKEPHSDKKVEFYNHIVSLLSNWIKSPYPVTQLQLLHVNNIKENHYNPNLVAPLEFELLRHSIEKDGLTIPIIVNKTKDKGIYTIVDGAHRFAILKSIGFDYIPCVILNKSTLENVATSVRHNIARGKHQVELTAKLVIELKNSNWSNEKIQKELGMDADEVLRMQQITGLAEAFKDDEFSQAWS